MLQRFDARCTHLDARRSVHAPRSATLGARTLTLNASAFRRSVHAPQRFSVRRSAHRCLDAQCTHHEVWVPSMRDLSGQVACQRSARQLRVVFGAGPCRICPGR
ncbi:UNVERIFIED_CONTAM: hypothetical protein FKN15_045464 [Acipenser sinensis]